MWVGLAGWQTGAFKRRPRDRWIGWRPAEHFGRLDLIANNTRLLLMGEPGAFPRLGSHFLSAMARRLSGDWMRRWGHHLLIAEASPIRSCSGTRRSGR